MSNKISTLVRLRQTERETRRNLIIDAAIHLFARMPFTQVGMREIAAEAGISAASIYRYFSDRDELFLEALLRESQMLAQGVRTIVGERADFSVEQVAERFVDYLLEHDTFFKMMTHFMIDGKIGATALERFNETERRLLDAFDAMFRACGVKKDVRLISHAFFASLNGIVITFRNYPGRDPEESRAHMLRLARVVAAVFKQGLT
jgi:AcrR family transcriptional regulator